MIKISENALLLGKMIEVYRIWNNASIARMISNEKGYTICGSISYQRIRNNKRMRDLQIYYDLLKNIGKEIYERSINFDFNKLNHAAEYYQYSQCVEESFKLLNELDHVKEKAYYDIMYESIFLIKTYYEGCIIKDINRIVVSIDVIALFPSKLRQVIYQVLFNCIRNITLPEKYNGYLMPDYTTFIDRVTNDASYLPLSFQRLILMQNKGLIIDAYEIIKSINSKLKEDNYLFNVNFYFIAFDILDGKTVEADSYYYKYKKIMCDETIMIPKRRKLTLLGNEIMYQMKKRRYQDCLSIIDSILCDSGERQLKLTIYYLFCMSQLNQTANLSLIPELDQWSSISDKEMICYFQFANRRSSIQSIINYIKILREKYIDDDEKIYIMILREELIKYSSILGVYRYSIEFDSLKYNPKSKKSLKKYKALLNPSQI